MEGKGLFRFLLQGHSRSLKAVVRADTQAEQGLEAEAAEELSFSVPHNLVITGFLIEPRPSCPRERYPRTESWALLHGLAMKTMPQSYTNRPIPSSQFYI